MRTNEHIGYFFLSPHAVGHMLDHLKAFLLDEVNLPSLTVSKN